MIRKFTLYWLDGRREVVEGSGFSKATQGEPNMISHAELVAEAERRGMPGRTLADVKACIAKCKKTGAAEDMARLMLRFGRLQPAAREWLAAEYPQ